MKSARLWAIALSVVAITVPVFAQRRRAVAPPPQVPTFSFDCKPAELTAAQAEQCRQARHAEGQRLFERETFGGNGRTCETCHSKLTGTFSATEARARHAANPNDSLFTHDGLDDGFSGTSTILEHATIRVTLPLPPYLTIREDPAATHVTFRRATPTTKNTPALDLFLMSDLRDANLEAQAAGAIRGHAQATVEPTRLQLELIAEFQKTDPRFFSDDRLLDFAKTGVAPLLPLGTTESEKRGRTFFEDNPPRANTMAGACAVCHSGPMLNETNRFARQALGVPQGMRTQSAGVSERNKLGNPVYTFEVHDGPVISIVQTPDIGLLMSDLTSAHVASELAALGPGAPLVRLANSFKIPTLWGVKDTAPYFHDNSAKDFDELLEHYNIFFQNLGLGSDSLKPQDIIDIKAFLNLL